MISHVAAGVFSLHYPDCVTDEPEDTRPEDGILRDGEEMLNSGEYERLIRMAQNTVAGQVRLAAAVTGPPG